MGGSGVLPELVELAGGAEHVITIADFGGARSGQRSGQAVVAAEE